MNISKANLYVNIAYLVVKLGLENNHSV